MKAILKMRRNVWRTSQGWLTVCIVVFMGARLFGQDTSGQLTLSGHINYTSVIQCHSVPPPTDTFSVTETIDQVTLATSLTLSEIADQGGVFVGGISAGSFRSAAACGVPGTLTAPISLGGIMLTVQPGGAATLWFSGPADPYGSDASYFGSAYTVNVLIAFGSTINANSKSDCAPFASSCSYDILLDTTAVAINFSASPTLISKGNTSRLTWTVTNASDVTIDQGIGTVPTSGFLDVSPSQTTTYTLTATGGSGTATNTATVVVTSPNLPIVTTFTASPLAVTAAASSVLSWSVSNATSVTINPGVGSVNPSQGSVTVSPMSTTAYTLTASNASGPVTANVTVTVNSAGSGSPPTIASFDASPTSISANQSSTLTWSVNNATSVSINNGVGTVNSSSGSAPVKPAATTTYTLTATGSNGAITTATATVTVTSGSAGSPPVIVSFSASPTSISAGQSSTLTWNVSGVTSVSLDPVNASLAPSGSIVVTPSTGTVYILRASNAAGSVIQAITVTVGPPLGPLPVITTFSASPTSISAGQATTLNWSVSGATVLSINNGVGDVTNSFFASVSPTSTSIYVLTASNSAGSVTKTLTVTVSPAQTGLPTITSFRVTPATISLGQSVQISWSVANSTSSSTYGSSGVEIVPIFGPVPASGTFTAVPTLSTKYVLTASNANGIVTSTAAVVVTGAPVGQIVSQLADGGSWGSTIILTNTNTQTAKYELHVIDEQGFGLPFGIAFPAVQTGSIPAGGLKVFNTPGPSSGSTVVGWANLVADSGVGGFTIFRQSISGQPDFEASVPFSASVQSAVIPFDNTNGYATGLALVNAGPPIAVGVKILSGAGQTILTDALTIGEMSHASFVLAAKYPVTSGNRGLVELQLDPAGVSQLGAIGLRFNPTGPFTSMLALPLNVTCTTSNGCPYSGQMAQFADGGAWETEIIAANTSANMAFFNLAFNGNNGAPMGISLSNGETTDLISGGIPAGGLVVADSLGAAGGNTVTGSGSLSGDFGIGGLAVFRERIPGRPDFEASVPFASPVTGAALPFDNTLGFASGVAIANDGNSSITVALTLIDEFGTSITDDNVVLGPTAHTSFALNTQYPTSEGRRGTLFLRTSSALGFTALGLRFNPTGPFTSVSSIALSKPGPAITSFSSTASMLVAGGTATLHWQVQNASKVTLTELCPSICSGSPTTDVTAVTSKVFSPSLSDVGIWTFQLTAYGSSGASTFQKLTITVSAPTPQIVSLAPPPFVASGDTADVVYSTQGATLITVATLNSINGGPGPVVASATSASGTLSFPVQSNVAYTMTASNGALQTSRTFTIATGPNNCTVYVPPGADDRTALQIAFRNDGSNAVDVRLYQQSNPTRPASVTTVPANANIFLPGTGTNSWGIRAGNFCTTSLGASSLYYPGQNWQATGNATNGLH